jgi:nitrogen fixation/metabolism regulation signal transduction histidine kinase
VTLRRKSVLYLVVIHIVFAALAVWALRENRTWLLAVEAVLLVSAIAGVKIYQAIFGRLDLVRTGVEFIKERDFGSRIREVGQPEMDELIEVYNRMIDNLREERIRVEETHHFLEEVIQASPSAIITLDFAGNVAMLNPSAERMFDMDAGQVVGKDLRSFDSPFVAALRELEDGESSVVPLHGNRRVKCQRSHFMDRGFARSFFMIEELTEELRRSERAAYEKIIRLMSHEINNSIGASGSLLHTCLKYSSQLQLEDRDDFETALQVAISRGQHLNSFVKSYADVIRLPKPDLRPCNVRQLLEDIWVLMKPECRERGISWSWEIQEDLGLIPMDKNQMEQVFVNILRNSVDAIGKDGRITIYVGGQNGRGFVVLEDTGHGIASDVRPNLFTPFFSTKENGRGIGLTMVQEILTNHHFDFSLESRSGEPTQFTIRF